MTVVIMKLTQEGKWVQREIRILIESNPETEDKTHKAFGYFDLGWGEGSRFRVWSAVESFQFNAVTQEKMKCGRG